MTFEPLFHSRSLFFFLAVSFGFGSETMAQVSFSDSSGLSKSAFLNERIKEIGDRQLWDAIDLDLTGLVQVRESVRSGNFDLAAIAWGAYWSTKKHPTYVTSMDHLLLDTDLLTPVADFRNAMMRSPEELKMTIARADQILQNKIKAWGDTFVDFGEKVDFNREIGQSGKYGFHYWIWSRALILAWAGTGDDKYLAKFDQLFQWWYEQRNSITRSIPQFDVVYYELGLGVRNRAFIEYYLSPYAGKTGQTHVRMLKTFLAAGRWLYEQEKWEGYRAGNWQIHGSYMLSQLGLVFPEFRESAEWRRVGLQRMMEHLELDFFADGGHSERSPRNYTMGTYLSYRNLAYLLSAYGVEHESAERIYASMGRTLEWWKSILAPTGEIPAVNDSHRGLFPDRIIKDGAALFGKQPESDSRYTSRHMPESGFTVMRSDTMRDALYLLLNYGPFAGFHSHYDLLDFELYAFGKPLAVDAGIGATYDDPLYPDWYRSSRAHNMVTVNDSSIERDGVQGENILWGSIASADYFSGEQQGYRRFGIQHRRQVAFVKPSYWFILDDLRCARSGDTLSWYFHSPSTLVHVDQGFASATTPGIRILPAGIPLSTRTGRGTAASTSDMTPGKTEEIGWVRFDQISSADSLRQFPMLLFPFQKAGNIPKALRLSPRHFIVREERFEDHLYFAETGYKDTMVETDGSFVLVRHTKTHGLRFTIVNGTFLKYGSKLVWSSSKASSGEGQIP
jgi:hypothetical protein